MTKIPETYFTVSPVVRLIDLNFDPPKIRSADEANARIHALAHGLLKLNLPKDARIALISPNSYEFVCVWFAIARAGLTCIPINYKLPQPQIDYCLTDSETSLIFYDGALSHTVPASIKSYKILSDEYEALLDYSPATMPAWDGDKINYIMYTSGTTGNPKGVITTYNNKYAAISISESRFVPGSRNTVHLQVSPPYHLAGINGLTIGLVTPNSASSDSIIVPHFDVKQYIRLIEQYKVTELRMVAPMMSMILQQKELLENTDLSSVRSIFLTSSHASETLQREAKKYFKNVNDILNPYGLTETGALFGQHPLGIPKPIGSVGYPLKGISSRIVDGVLQVKSDAILSGYLNKDSLYQKVMTEDGYFITGDLFRANKHGFYFYQGRADDMFKSGGEKIYPTELEAIIDKHPMVAISSVLGLPDEIKGHKAYVFAQLKPDASLTADDLKAWIIENVATYQIPRCVWIIDNIPKTPIGKIDKVELTKMANDLLANVK